MPRMRARRRYARPSLAQRLRNRRRRARGIRQKSMYQSQLFTETFKCNTQALPPTNIGVGADGVIKVAGGTQFTPGKFMVKITDIPQIQNYANLQQFYKILKVTQIIVPKFNVSDPNVGQYNQANSVAAWEVPRMAYAINDSTNDLATPTSELDVLEDNGVRIKRMTNPFKITFRPKAALDSTDPTTSQLVPSQPKYRPWLGFGPDDGAITPADAPYHVGVDWVISCDNTATSEFLDVADVYCKVSFVCKDPR